MLNYAFFGWVSVVSLAVLILPFILVRLNKHLFKTKHSAYFKLIKLLRQIHKPLGIVFVAVALIHGIMVLGSFRLHTGWLLFISLVVTVFSGGAFYRLKKKPLFQLHKWFALIVVLLFLLHFFKPYAI